MTIPNCKDCKHFVEPTGPVSYELGGFCNLTPLEVHETTVRMVTAANRMAGDCGPEGKYFEEGGNE